MNQQICNNRRK